MFDLIVFLVLAALAFPVIAIVALVKASGLRDIVLRLGVRVETLEQELAALRRTATATPPTPVTSATTSAAISPPEILSQPEPTPASAEPAPPPSAEPPPLPPQPAPLPPSSVPTIAPAPTAPPARPPQISFEERFGTRWTVWVGGIALALGGIFLVRYTIQQGLIGPGVRIALGALLALALVAAGEWARRNERLAGLPGLPTADIPSILTAAGTVVAYAVVYAAYALYGFLPPPVAFVLLGLVALATLAAALLHGPALAGLGVVGAFVTPLLVASAEPDYWSLYVYIAIVTAAAFALARIRLWRWLAVTAIVLGALWTLPGAGAVPVEALGAHVFNALAGFALAAALLVSGLLFGPATEPGEIDWLSALALAVYLLVAALLVLMSRHDAVAFTAFVILTAATIAIAWRAEGATGAVPVAAILAAVVMADWSVAMNASRLLAPAGPTAAAFGEPQRYDYGWHLALAALWAGLFGGAGFLAQGRPTRALAPMLWSASAVFVPLAMLIALYYRIAALDQSLPFAALALLLAAVFAWATETLLQRPPRPGLRASCAIFATGALAALALALTFALERGWLTVGLALIVAGTAWVAAKRPLPWLRWLAAIMTVIVVARIGYEPRIAGDDLGTTPIFNWLLYGYGVPALSFWIGGWLLRRQADDEPARIVDAGAILFTVLLVVLEIRHYVTHGDIYRPARGMLESALDVNAGLALTMALERLRARTRSIVHDAGALIVAALTLCAILFEFAAVAGRGFGRVPIEGAFFNSILLGYGLPAVLAIVLALIARTTRPMSYRVVAAVTAVTLALFYLTLEVRRLFHGPFLWGGISDAEQYCYSTVWLAFGIVLLAAGFLLRSPPARYLALGVITLTIAKVFLVDTASITGIYRALSVIGLGIVLLGIGWLYQRLLYPRTPPSGAPAAGA